MSLGDGLVDWVAGGDHDPDGAGGFELLHQFLEAGGSDIATGGEFGDSFRIEVEADYLMTAESNPLCHKAAHFAEADESELHVLFLRLAVPDIRCL
jgi:hypothetical protein